MEIKGLFVFLLIVFFIFSFGCTDTVGVNIIDSNAITTSDANITLDKNKPLDTNLPVTDKNIPVFADMNSIKREISDCTFNCASTSDLAVSCSQTCFNEKTQNMTQSQKIQLLSSCISPCRAKGGEEFACLESCRGKELTMVEKCLQSCTIGGKTQNICLEECKFPGAISSDKNSPSDTNNP